MPLLVFVSGEVLGVPILAGIFARRVESQATESGT